MPYRKQVLFSKNPGLDLQLKFLLPFATYDFIMIIWFCTKLKLSDVTALNHWEYIKLLIQGPSASIFKRFPKDYLRIGYRYI